MAGLHFQWPGRREDTHGRAGVLSWIEDYKIMMLIKVPYAVMCKECLRLSHLPLLVTDRHLRWYVAMSQFKSIPPSEVEATAQRQR
jgi:hypothetical protein